MKITRKNPLTGKNRTMELDITEEEVASYIAGSHAQHAFPRLNHDEREFYEVGTIGRVESDTMADRWFDAIERVEGEALWGDNNGRSEIEE